MEKTKLILDPISNGKAVLIQDYIYSMKETGVDKRTCRRFYTAVRCFGETSWKPKLLNEGYKDKAIIDKTKEAKEYYNYWYKMLGIR